MGWDAVTKFLNDSNDKDRVPSTYNECVEDTGNNVDIDDGQTDGNAGNVDHGYTDTHVDARTWSDVVNRGSTGGRNVHICTA